MRGGYSLFNIFPDIDQEVKAVLMNHQTCASCQNYDYPKKSMFCEPRSKVVRKRTGIRLYCFKPIDFIQLEARREFDREKQRNLKRECLTRWRKKNKDKQSEYRKKYRLEHLDEIHSKANIYRLAHIDACRERSKRFYYSNIDRERENHLIHYYINREDPLYTVMQTFRHFDRKERKRIQNMMKVPFNTHLTLDDQAIIKGLKADGRLGDSSKFYLKR